MRQKREVESNVKYKIKIKYERNEVYETTSNNNTKGENSRMIKQLDVYTYIINGEKYDKRNMSDLLYIESMLKLENLADTKADTVKAEKVEADTIDDEEIEEIKVDKIDFKQDVFLPTREDIRNNNREE